jgi:hypothetical protein
VRSPAGARATFVGAGATPPVRTESEGALKALRGLEDAPVIDGGTTPRASTCFSVRGCTKT